MLKKVRKEILDMSLAPDLYQHFTESILGWGSFIQVFVEIKPNSQQINKQM